MDRQLSDEDVAIIINESDIRQPCMNCGKCPGFVPHKWRLTCSACRCPRLDHAVCNARGVNIRARLGVPEPEDKALTIDRHAAVAAGFLWIPPGLKQDQLEGYFKNIPRPKIPKIGSEGEKFRDSTIIKQWPRQDLDPKYCKSLKTQAEQEAYRKMRYEIVRNGTFEVGFSQNCPKRGMECVGCPRTLSKSDIIVSCPRLETSAWHPECFKCETCGELLMDLAHAINDKKVYCGRHYGEQLRPRCMACDELIMADKNLKIGDDIFHEGHHTCVKCDKELTKFHAMNGAHYCLPCAKEVKSG